MTADTRPPAPDFIIIGAMKAGTSTLYDQLSRQPDVFMTTPKEPAFFADDAVFRRGWDWYASLFADAPAGSLRGEASTHYTKLPTFPETVARMGDLPHAPKLIYVIRNPMERARSHVLHEISQGVITTDIASAVEAHPEIEAYSRYPMQISPFLDTFGPDAVLLTSLEQLRQDPAREMALISDHLGAGRTMEWDDAAPPQNVSADRVRRFPLHGLLIENPVAKALRRALVPQAIRQKIRKSRTIGAERPDFPNALKAQLRAAFEDDRAEMAKLFPDHPALDLCYRFDAP